MRLEKKNILHYLTAEPNLSLMPDPSLAVSRANLPRHLLSTHRLFQTI